MYAEQTPIPPTGIDSIDGQHEAIRHAIVALRAAIDMETSKETRLARLRSLEAVVHSHFFDEERLMSSTNCPFATLNKNEHDQFLIGFRHMMEAIGDPVLNFRLAHQSVDLFHSNYLDHVQRIDMRLSDRIPKPTKT